MTLTGGLEGSCLATQENSNESNLTRSTKPPAAGFAGSGPAATAYDVLAATNQAPYRHSLLWPTPTPSPGIALS